VTSASTSTDKAITADCATVGKTLIGGGGETSLGSEVNLSQSGPTSATAWTARGNEEGNVGGNWTVTAYAFCATP
jgi:hypothetical protein